MLLKPAQPSKFSLYQLLQQKLQGSEVVCLHLQVIKANDDLTPEHHQFFLYQMLRGLKYIHTGQSGANNAKLK